ncbi:MAG: hypothetical protein AB1679_02495 [Actinomycetota bacterium]|jgi:hypothetical protein
MTTRRRERTTATKAEGASAAAREALGRFVFGPANGRIISEVRTGEIGSSRGSARDFKLNRRPGKTKI